MTVEIAPNVFARSWDDVITGYHHPSEQFIIDINLGGDKKTTIAVRGDADIAKAVETFRNHAEPITEPIPIGESTLPPEIDQWMAVSQELTQGKRINYRKG